MTARTTLQLRKPHETHSNLSIVIAEFAGELEILLNTPSGFYRIKSDISLSKMEELALRLNNSIEAFGQKLWDGANLTECQRLLFDPFHGPASIGYLTMNLIFGVRGREILAEVNKQIQGSPTVQIISDYPFPWEWLYDEPPDDNVVHQSLDIALSHFWALNRVIARGTLQRQIEHEHEFRFTLPLTSKFSVGMIVDPSLNNAQLERDALNTLSQENSIRTSYFRIARALKPFQAVESLEKFLERDFDVLHIACHVGSDKSRLWLEPGEGFKFDLDYARIRSHDDGLKTRLVFLNAASNNRDVSRFVDSFKQLGVQNVIALNRPIRSTTAVKFAQRFYAHFLSGKNVGQSVRGARKDLLDSVKDPADITCLSYAFFGDPDLRRDVTHEVNE